MVDKVEVMCEHVYKEMGVDICPLCGLTTHRVDWKEQARVHREWIASGKARYLGWFSI
jgi:rRNA maturation endonuclease Nob1